MQRGDAVNSGPSSGPGPSQGQLFEDIEDEVKDLINTQSLCLHEAQVDDPQLDWRTQDPSQLSIEEDDISEPDDTHAIESEPAIPQVIISAQDASQAKPYMTLADIKVHQRYLLFLMDLCDKTGTDSLGTCVKDGLIRALHRAQSISLDKDLSADEDLDLYGLALVIHVWQVVCLRVQFGLFPDDSLAVGFGAYFLSAHAVAEHYHAVAFPQLMSAVQYWEHRLNNANDHGLWEKEAWLRSIVEMDSTLPQNRNETANEYLQSLLESGKSHLAFLVMQRDASGQHSTPLRKYTEGERSNKVWALAEVTAILSSMDIELLKSLIDGSLSRKAEIPAGHVSNALLRIQDQNPSPPSIYQNCICDLMGMSPTPVQWERVCNHMLEYVQGGTESNELAMMVDQLIYPTDEWPPQLAKRGLRRYTEWRSYVENDGDQLPSISHRRMVRYFVSEMMDRISVDLQSGRGHIPLAAPVIEIGFSINARYRLREHRRHEHSNYLMNLAEAMFKHLYPNTFRLQQLVIYACFRPSHPWFSEIILTQLGQGYTEGAGGFSHYPAGRSNGSAYYKTSRSEWQQFYYEATRSGSLEREARQIFINNKASYEKSKQDIERTHSALIDELDFYDKLNDTLDSMIDLVNAENDKLASEQRDKD